jgi:hypothetical protein
MAGTRGARLKAARQRSQAGSVAAGAKLKAGSGVQIAGDGRPVESEGEETERLNPLNVIEGELNARSRHEARGHVALPT